MNTFVRCVAVALLGLGVGCGGDDPVGQSAGNSAIGIARFEIDDTATKTSVVGFDADDNEVARLDLIHGRFALTGQFAQDYDTPEVDGRKLDVFIRSEKRLTWETAGYAPTLHMPAHPARETEVAAFLADAHVRPVLEQWQIGFDPPSMAGDEIAFASGSSAGTSPFDCSTPATSCGTARTFTMNTCGSGAAANEALRLSRTTAGGFTYNEYWIDQCCPPVSGVSTTNWFAQKSCPNTGAGAQPSSCGTTGATAACKGCPGYPTTSGSLCEMTTTSTSNSYCYNTSGTSIALTLSASGTIESNIPGYRCTGGTCNHATCTNSSVTLTRNDVEIDDFAGWTGCTSSSGDVCNVTMSSAKSITASYNTGTFSVDGGSSSPLSRRSADWIDLGQLGYSYATHTIYLTLSKGVTWSLVAGACDFGGGTSYDWQCTLNPGSWAIYQVTNLSNGYSRDISMAN